MRVFVTGASGFVGSAVVQELLRAGHQVLGLARSDASAEAIRAAGAEVHRGDLDDLDSLRRGAAESDGVIHTGYNHDFSNMAGAAVTDSKAIEVIGAELAGSGRPFITTGGTAGIRLGQVLTEYDGPDPQAMFHPRIPNLVATLALAEQNVRAMVVRLSPTVHGAGDHGFVPIIINFAREKGVSAYVGDGLNRWSAVHRLDVAVLYRLALEKGEAGASYHGVAEEGIPMRDIAEVIGRKLNLPVISKTAEEAPAHFSWMARFIGLDIPASSALSQQRLGWKPTHAGLLADMEACYF